jgi:RNA polymerase sigma factor (sigma-70 family)
VSRWGADARYTRLVEEHGESLLHFAILLTGNRYDAEDIVQDVLIQVATKWNSVGSLAYLRKAVANRAIDKSRLWREVSVDEIPDAPIHDSGYFRLEQDERFFARVRGLPEGQRAVLVLRFHQQLDDRAIAGILGCSVQTVRSQAHRGMAKLRAEALAEVNRGA